MLLNEEEVEPGLYEATMNEVRGLDQPGANKRTPEQRQLQRLDSEVKYLIDKCLKPKGWKWRKRMNGYCLLAPGFTSKDQEVPFVNMFPPNAYLSLAEHNPRTGSTECRCAISSRNDDHSTRLQDQICNCPKEVRET